ncbi:MAG: response regulator [Elusimicrobiota bacterium]
MKKILIAEDDENLLGSLSVIFAENGYTVITASDGEEAIEKFKQEQPDIVLTDISMPKVDGFGVCKTIRELKGLTKYVPIIMMSGTYDKLEFRFDVKKTGADDFIIKPFKPEEMVKYCDKLLKDIKTKQVPTKTKLQILSIKPSVEKKVVVYYPDGSIIKGTTSALHPGETGFNMTVWGEDKRIFVNYNIVTKVEVVDEF